MPTKSKKPTQNKKSVSKEKVSFSTPRGMHDLLPEEWILWSKFQKIATEISEFYGYSRIETPVLENIDLFIRGVGETTDIVEKEMFTLKTKGGDRLVLRPEVTTSVVRSYIQHGMNRLPQPVKLYYSSPVFRHEKPQAGRYRQFNQFGLEIVGGESDPVYDAQVIIATYRFLEKLRIKPLLVQINSIGCRTCRTNYRKRLIEYYKKQEVCRDCARRLDKNPLRLLDCKNETCMPTKLNAPSILDHLCTACRGHFKSVLEYLDEVEIPYTLNPYLVRGLDYYNRTVFEIFMEGKDLALASGGRYDYLSEMLGGKSTPGIGMAAGIERIIEIMKEYNLFQQPKIRNKIFLIHVGEVTKKKSLSLIEEFRKENLQVAEALGKDSLSSQLERAAKMDARISLIFGQKEAFEDSIIIRDMETGVQEPVPLSKVVDEIKRRLK